MLVFCMLMVTLVLVASSVLHAFIYHRGLLALGLIVTFTVAGGAMGWWMRPTGWTLSFKETWRIAIDAARYGHTLESQAERVLLYPIESAFLGVVLSCVTALIVSNARAQSGKSR